MIAEHRRFHLRIKIGMIGIDWLQPDFENIKKHHVNSVHFGFAQGQQSGRDRGPNTIDKQHPRTISLQSFSRMSLSCAGCLRHTGKNGTHCLNSPNLHNMIKAHLRTKASAKPFSCVPWSARRNLGPGPVPHCAPEHVGNPSREPKWIVIATGNVGLTKICPLPRERFYLYKCVKDKTTNLNKNKSKFLNACDVVSKWILARTTTKAKLVQQRKAAAICLGQVTILQCQEWGIDCHIARPIACCEQERLLQCISSLVGPDLYTMYRLCHEAIPSFN